MKDDFISKYAIEGTVHDFSMFGPSKFYWSEITDDRMRPFSIAPSCAMLSQWKSMVNKKERGKNIILLSEFERDDGKIHYWFTHAPTTLFMIPELEQFMRNVVHPLADFTCWLIRKAVDEDRVKRYTAYCMESDLNPEGYEDTMNFTLLKRNPAFLIPGWDIMSLWR